MRHKCPIEPLGLRAAALAVLGVLIMVAILSTPDLWAQGPTDWQTRAGGKMVFDVASIKLNKGAYIPSNFPLDVTDDTGSANGRLSADETLGGYIEFAYKVWWSEVESRDFSHLPNWVDSDRYGIEARAAGNPTKDQMRLMMQSLLVDRFHLTAHFETREVPVFELRLARPGKPGPRLIPHADGPSCDKPGASPVKEVPSFHIVCGRFSPMIDLGTTLVLGSRDVSMDVLAGGLSEALAGPLALGRPIIDKTGLTGKFDFTLEWARERRTTGGADSPVASDPIGPTPLEALREQLGLKLESTKAAIPILIIDKVERPSEN